jgi:hypothetical protein
VNRTRVAVVITAFIALLLAVAGCSSVSTSASEVALQYEGGPIDSSAYYDCFGGGTKEYNDAEDVHYYYPTGQRDFSFGDARGLDSAALTSTTKNAQEIKVTGTVKFTMNLSCSEFKDSSGKTWPGGTAQYFHELFGSKDRAYNTEGGRGYGDGWSKMLQQYMGFGVDREVDDEALAYTLDELNVDRAKKDQWENAVARGLPATLKAMTGGVEIFKINEVLLQRPGVRSEIADAQAAKQAAQIRAEAVGIDQEAALSFPGGIVAYQAYQQQQAINEAIKSGKVKVLPIPAGSPVIVNGN